MVWATAAALAIMLSLVVVLVAVVLVNGMGVFWPSRVAEFTLTDGSKVLGQSIRSETNPDNGQVNLQIKSANREMSAGRQDFRWIAADKIAAEAYPAEVCILERIENGDFFGFVDSVEGPDLERSTDASPRERLAAGLKAVRAESARQLEPVARQIAAIGARLESLKDTGLKARYRRGRLESGSSPADPARLAELDEQLKTIQDERGHLKHESDRLVAEQRTRLDSLRRNVALFHDAAGAKKTVALLDIVRSWYPNAMSWPAKVSHYVSKVWELLTADPRESNTEGGLFPAIFGTVMMVFLMAAACFPLGVLAGIYLGEYAREGWLVRTVRIAVSNLAGIPSIVYGIFGMGFFVYGIGGLLDQWLFPERVAVNTPTFGTGGILWASLTLGLLTVPVVIVATEEALRSIPRSLREGSLALGATKFQTLTRVLVPMASPRIMTGFILAMARAAGEVAPLMITGVVKLAPQLPVDGTYPYLHFDRKFMHLGFHIYDVGFQSPNVEASKPMVYVTTLLLLLIVLMMTSVAIWLRNRMRKRFQLRGI
jgi:phosphate transport system permease protein